MTLIARFVVVFLSLNILASNGENIVTRKGKKFKVCREGQCQSLKSLPSLDYLNKLLFSFGGWGTWSSCNDDCSTFRSRFCRFPILCGSTVVHEEAFCFHRGSRCENVYNNHRKQLGLGLGPLLDYYVRDDSIDRSRDSVINPDDFSRRRMYNDNDHYYFPGTSVTYPQNSEGGQRLSSREPLANGLRRETCGVARVTDRNRRGLTTRILGGKETKKGRWPWQVAISASGEVFCGGTLIADRWIITAAHCVRRRIEVTIGEHQLHTREGTERQFRIDTAFIHPHFNIETVDNDIALLLLPEPVSSEAGLACLPVENQPLPPSGTMCTILGWGKERYNHVFGSSTLHEGRIPLVSNADCRLTYDPSELTNNMFCGGYKNGTVDSCAGDSGGPLLCRTNNRWTLFGVTSFGDGCGRVGKYGIYAKVPNFVSWIYKVISATEESPEF